MSAAQAWFGTIDVLGHRYQPVPGAFEALDYRAQDPQGAYGGPMLVLREGRYPTAAREVAVTDAVADSFELDLGTPFALDGTGRIVVGLVENPSDLSDEFALVSPAHGPPPESVTILVDASSDRVKAFRPPSGGAQEIASRGGGNEDVLAAVGVLGVATVGLLLVALLAAAGFVVIAQRRLSAGHARRDRRDREAPPSRDGGKRRGDRCRRGRARDRHRPAGLDRGSTAAGDGARASHRPFQRAMVAGRDGHAARVRDRDRGSVVAGPDGGSNLDRARWRSAQSRRARRRCRSRVGWPCATSPGIRPGRVRLSRPSAWCWVSRWPSWSPPPPLSTPPGRATCRSASCRSGPPPTSTGRSSRRRPSLRAFKPRSTGSPPRSISRQ